MVSSSMGYTVRVCSTRAATSLAMYISPSPCPISSGLRLRAQYSVPGARASRTPSAYEPSSMGSTRRSVVGMSVS